MKETHAKINLKPKNSMCWTVRKRTHFRMFRILFWYLIHTEPEGFFQQEPHYLSFHVHSPHRLEYGYNVKYRIHPLSISACGYKKMEVFARNGVWIVITTHTY